MSIIPAYSALACSMCLSGADGELAAAVTWGIGLMVILLCGVLGAFFGFIIYLAKMSRRESELAADGSAYPGA